jgi:hypothetical protein
VQLHGTNLAAIPTTAPAPVPSTTTTTPPTAVVGSEQHRHLARPGVGSIMVGLLGCAELGGVGFQLGVGGLQVQDLGDAGEVDPGIDEVGDAP